MRKLLICIAILVTFLNFSATGHSFFTFCEWDKTTNWCNCLGMGNTAESWIDIQHAAAWLGVDSIGGGMDLIHWAVNSDKWSCWGVGYDGYADKVPRKSSNQILFNHIDWEFIKTSDNAVNNFEPFYDNLHMSKACIAGDFWVKPPKDEYIGTHFEDIDGNWLPIGTKSTVKTESVRNKWIFDASYYGGKPYKQRDTRSKVNGVAVTTAFTFACTRAAGGWRGNIVRFDIENGKVVKTDTIFHADNGICHNPTISPDGKYVAFFRDGDKWNDETSTLTKGGADHMCVMDIDGKNVRELITFEGDLAKNYVFRNGEDRLMDWPIGGWIYYNRPHHTCVIWRVNVDNPSKHEKFYAYKVDPDHRLRRWNMSLDGTVAAGDNLFRQRPHEFPPGIVPDRCTGGCNGSISCGGRYRAGWGPYADDENKALIAQYHRENYEYVPTPGSSVGARTKTITVRNSNVTQLSCNSNGITVYFSAPGNARAVLFDLQGKKTFSAQMSGAQQIHIPRTKSQSMHIVHVVNAEGKVMLRKKIMQVFK